MKTETVQGSRVQRSKADALKLRATVRTDDDDRLFAEIVDVSTGELFAVLTESDFHQREPVRAQVEAWARERGHEMVSVKLEGLV